MLHKKMGGLSLRLSKRMTHTQGRNKVLKSRGAQIEAKRQSLGNFLCAFFSKNRWCICTPGTPSYYDPDTKLFANTIPRSIAMLYIELEARAWLRLV